MNLLAVVLPDNVFFLLASILLTSLHFVQSSMSTNVVLGPFAEQQRAGVLIGNIARASNINSEAPSEFKTLRYEFLNTADLQTVSLFTLNAQTGGLFTSAMIDRENVCEYKEECLIKFDVTVSSDVINFFRIVKVSVNVTDINDNVPTFPKETITLDIAEGNNIGIVYPLPVAIDKDTKVNSVQGYSILSTTDAFDLQVERNLDESFKVALVVNKVLDREERDSYTVRVTARDGGLQPLTGTLTVNINVTDINDNAPVFSQRSYSLSVVENAPVGTVIGRVYATDIDAGNNAKITYTFSGPVRSKIQELFHLDPTRGEIQIKAPLQYVSGNTFDAIIEARDAGSPSQVTQAQLIVAIVDVGNNPPRVELILQRTVYGKTVLIAETSRVGTFIGTVRVYDNDPGTSGIVNCRSSHPSFRVQDMGADNGFAIQLHSNLDRELEEKVNVTISCSDSGAPPMTSTTEFNVLVADVNDNPPVFTQYVYIANVTEETKSGVEVIRVSANDIDKGANSQFYYQLHPPENEMFVLDSKTGVLTSNMVFDRETDMEVTVIVKAIDEGEPAQTGSATIEVHILDINDNAPEVTSREFHIKEGKEGNRFVGKLKARDKDAGINAAVEFFLKPTIPLPPFSVYPDGTIKTNTNSDIDREFQDLYVFEILVNDLGTPKLTSSATVTVHILDVNDNSPELYFPTSKNNTVTIMWNQTPQTPFAQINASDPDDGKNSRLVYFIASGNKNNLFDVSKERGTVFLSRYIEPEDPTFYNIKIAVQDSGDKEQRETQSMLMIRIDITNATFASQEGPAEMEKNILIAGIVGGATIVISIILLVVIWQVRILTRRPIPSKYPREFDNDKTGIQEECGKTEMEKIAWKTSESNLKGHREVEDVEDSPEAGGPNEHVTMGKVVRLPWSSGRTGAGDLMDGGHFTHSGPDQYRKQEFYTFCKVRSPHDDVNSVTSGETTTSDSGRGGSEDDTPLPPIAEVPPECSSLQCLPFDRHSERSTSPLSPMKSGFGSPETKVLPLSSFREPENRKLFANAKMSLNDPNTHLYSGDKVHPSSLKRSSYANPPTSFPNKTGGILGSNRSLPLNKSAGSSGRQVTFANSKSLPRFETGKRAPFPPAYEQLVLESGNLYTSLPRGSGDEDDGNTTTSGSYTLETADLDDTMS